MEKLNSILVVIDPHQEMHRTLEKALLLARRFGAKIELFLCDSDRARVLPRQSAEKGEAEWLACIADGRKYLESLRSILAAADVPISIDVACHTPLYESVLAKARASAPDLVIKAAAGRHPMRKLAFDENDWRLARNCPATLMLTKGRQWTTPLRFAATVDVSETAHSEIARMIAHTSDYLSTGCNGVLDLLYSEPSRGDIGEHASRFKRLQQLAEEHLVSPDRVHHLQGDAEQTLPSFAAEQHYDVLVLGALTRRRGLGTLIGTLTSKLVDALDCDFVLVKPPSVECAEGEYSGSALSEAEI